MDGSKLGEADVSILEDAVPGDGHVPAANIVSVDAARRGVKQLWKIYAAIEESIQFFDTKAGVILAANGVLIGAGVSVLQGDQNFAFGHPAFLVFAAVALLSLSASALCCLICISPSTVTYHPRHRKADSPIFFAHIANLDCPEDYEKAVVEKLTDPRQALWHLSEQVWAIARVASRKARLIPFAVLFLSLGLLFALLALFGAAL